MVVVRSPLVSQYERFAFGPERTKDKSSRDPIGTIGRARDALRRARTIEATPDWFDGTVDQYRAALTEEVEKLHGVLKDEEPSGAVASTADSFDYSGEPAKRRANRFTKDVLRVGEFHHPAQKAPVAFPLDRLKDLVSNTRRLIEQGVKIPAPLRHTNDPAANIGFWSNPRVTEDGRLVADLSVEDPDVLPKIGKTLTDVSVRISPNHKAPDGTVLDEVIDHICITSYPVIAGQKNFEPATVALSFDRDGAAIYRMKSEKRTVDPLAKIKAKLNLSAGATEDEVEAALQKFENAETERQKLADQLDAEKSGKVELLDRLGRLEADKIEREVAEFAEKGVLNEQSKARVRALLSHKADSGKVTHFDKDGAKREESVPDAVRGLLKTLTPWTVDLSRRMSGKVVELSQDADKSEIAEANRLTEYEAQSMERQNPGMKVEWSKDEDGRKSYRLVPSE